MQQRNVVRLAPVENSSENRVKVGKGAGRLLRARKLKWGRIRTPCGVQFDARISCGRKGDERTVRQDPAGEERSYAW